MTALRASRILRRDGAWDPFGVRWLMGRVHVATPEADVRQDIARRTAKWPNPETREAMAVYALAVHRHNRREYRRVMGGAR